MSHLRVRFAPSPTGYLHIGGARTALFNFLLARSQQGVFVLRIEDTDQQRSTREAQEAILEGLRWLGLDWDEGPVYQSQRRELYAQKLQQLLDNGQAYRCYCTPEELEAKRRAALNRGEKPKYDGTCRHRQQQDANAPHVIRFRSPDSGSTAFTDRIKGRIEVANSELDDLILQRTDGGFTYNFVVVIDDAEMGINLVLRGDDHVNNTPRQLLLYQALGYPLPEYAHVPMILGADKTRLSKRHGATSVLAYRDMGYLPEALVNYLVRLGWSHGDQEIFRLEELIQLFDIKAVGKSASVFNPEKLDWLNSHYIKEADSQRLGGMLSQHLQSLGINTADGPDAAAAADSLRERCQTLQEMAREAVFYYQHPLSIAPEVREKFLTADRRPLLADVRQQLAAIEQWHAEQIEACIKAYLKAEKLKMGKVGPVIRAAVVGATSSPSIFAVLAVLGRERTLQRLDATLKLMAEQSQ